MSSVVWLAAAVAIALAMGGGVTEAVQVYAVYNPAINTPGGARFNNEVNPSNARQTMISATNFIWYQFRQFSAADRLDPPRIALYIEDYDGVARRVNNNIYLSARYIQKFSGDIRKEVYGIIYHEITHLLQWQAGSPPLGLVEGIADFIRLRAGYAKSDWARPGDGRSWDHGYDVTARFLDYCESLRYGFVADLNKKMRYGYSNNFFVELLGKSVDQLWRDYKRRYGGGL